MWSNFKNIANEAIEAAIDIKQHIAEVTTNEVEACDDIEIIKEEYSDEFIESVIQDLKSLKAQNKDLEEKYLYEKNSWNNEKTKFEEIIRTLESAVSEKDKEIEWEAKNYQNQMQELIKSKNRLQRELNKLSEELITLKSANDESFYLSEKIEGLENSISMIELEKKEIIEEKNEWKQKYDNFLKNEEDKVSRSFFIQFLSTLNRNFDNPQEKQELLESLSKTLLLTTDEKFLLGIEPKSRLKPEEKLTNEEEISLFDTFTNFLSGFNS